MNLFESSLDVGKAGEDKIINYFTQSGKSVINVANNIYYQNKDIDLIVNKATVEIKTDNHVSDSIFVEVCTNVKNNTDGWLKKSKAQFLIYYFTVTNLAYFFRLEDLRKFLSDGKYNVITSTPKYDNKQVSYYIVPIEDMINNFCVVKIKL